MAPTTRSRARMIQGRLPLLHLPRETRFTIWRLVWRSVRFYYQPLRHLVEPDLLPRDFHTEGIDFDYRRGYSIWATGSCGILFVSRQCYAESRDVARSEMTYDISRSIGVGGQGDALETINTISKGQARYIYGIDFSEVISDPDTLLRGLARFRQLKVVTMSRKLVELHSRLAFQQCVGNKMKPETPDEDITDEEIYVAAEPCVRWLSGHCQSLDLTEANGWTVQFVGDVKITRWQKFPQAVERDRIDSIFIVSA